MFKMKYRSFIILLISVLALVSCGEYEKLLKSSDYDLKYEKALEYYENEEYVRAATLIEQILPRFRATNKADSLLYYQAYSHYNQGDYILAGYYFRNFSKTYNNSSFTEECDFMGAYCHYLMSPKAILDQTNTTEAINSFALFMAKYPNSERVNAAQEYIKEMRDKLVYKSYKSAKLYFDLEDYKAAIVALRSSLKEYPETIYREEILYLILRSRFLLAENSIPAKKRERYQATIDEYYAFIGEYPESNYAKDAGKMFEKAKVTLNIN